MVKSRNHNGSKVICEYDSKNLKKGEYDTATNKLQITFNNGATYEYEKVPIDTFNAMNLAESQGVYFNKNIAKTFSYKKVN